MVGARAVILAVLTVALAAWLTWRPAVPDQGIWWVEKPDRWLLDRSLGELVFMRRSDDGTRVASTRYALIASGRCSVIMPDMDDWQARGWMLYDAGTRTVRRRLDQGAAADALLSKPAGHRLLFMDICSTGWAPFHRDGAWEGLRGQLTAHGVAIEESFFCICEAQLVPPRLSAP